MKQHAPQLDMFAPTPAAPDNMREDTTPATETETIAERVERRQRAKEQERLALERIYRVRVHPFIGTNKSMTKLCTPEEKQPYIETLQKFFRNRPDVTILVEERGVVHSYYSWNKNLKGWDRVNELETE